jgi:enoyl-CoA hydratase
MPVRLTSDDGIAVVTIDREEALNALDVETLEALRGVLTEVAAAAAVRVVVLTGAGEKAFAAGADIKYMSGLEVDGALAWGALGHEVGRLLETMPKPTIAAVNGFALGGGCELALACDIRYCSSRAKLGQPEGNAWLMQSERATRRS